MSIRSIILEELKALIEGTGDVYAANKWGIEDKGTEFEKKYQQHLKTQKKDDINGELVGTIRMGKYNQSNIYKNPKDLRNFEPEVRAVSDRDGNIFVAQLDGPFYHQSIANGIEVEDDWMEDAYSRLHNITWHRIGSTNGFCYSISFKNFADDNREFMDDDKPSPALRVRYEKLKSKNPTLTFEDKYCGDLGQTI